jgi:hypothetical protein
LYQRWSGTGSEWLRSDSETGYSDPTGACGERIETAQAFLTPDEVDEMLALYGPGMTAVKVAEKFEPTPVS